MFNLIVLVIFILSSFFSVSHSQHIFDHNYSTCEYITQDNYTEKEDQKILIMNKLWAIIGSGRQSGSQIFLSPCGGPIQPTQGCGTGAAACILNSKTPGKSILNAGRYFNYTYDENSGRNILQSIEGQPCASAENYTVIVQFECSPQTKITPVYLYKDECEVRIEMMKPTCTPVCTARINGNLIDLRPLQKLGSLAIEDLNTKRSFVISFCRAAIQCGSDILACETTGGSIVPIADINWQRITYDSYNDALVIKSHFGNAKQSRIDTEIHVKCNWNVEAIANIKYVVPVTQGKKYKFEAESSLACIKLPMNCIIKDSFKNYFVYNLSSLNKETAPWRVGNASFGSIYINICGPLHMPQRNSACNDQYSQVCFINGMGHQINLGSIPVQFHATSKDTVRGTFTNGNICAINQNHTYSTEIEFLCSSVEKGPILQAVNNCTYKIGWETPAACSLHYATSDNCVMSDVTGNINLNNIHSALDKTYVFTQTSYLRYNLCGPLNQPCNKNANVSICYVSNGREYIVGFSSKMLRRDNASLRLNLVGDKCNSRTFSMTNVRFHCNYSAPIEGIFSVDMVNDGCMFELNIQTQLACTSSSFTACRKYNYNSVFNLAPLSNNNSNYEVHDSNSDIVYIMNICRSVINSEDTLCPPYSGVCMYNKSEPHIKYRYLSMGQVNDKSTPAFEDGNLIIRYDFGSYCPEAESLKRSTIIRFECSNREEGARLLRKNSCFHEFIWRTPNACGKQVLSVNTRSTNNCKYVHPHTGELIDFENVNTLLQIETLNGDLYKFSLCEKNYTHCTASGGECNILNSTIQLFSDNIRPYFVYSLNNTCHKKGSANKLHIYLICDPVPNNEYFNITGIRNCTIHINFLTSLACFSKGNKINLLQARNSQLSDETIKNNKKTGYTTDAPFINYNTSPSIPAVTIKSRNKITTENPKNSLSTDIMKLSTENKCSVKNIDTRFKLELKTIKPIKVISSSGDNYTVLKNKPSSPCNGFICKNDLQIVLDGDECPVIKFNYTVSVVKLLYDSYQVCDNGRYHTELWLKCNSTTELPSVFMESKCNVTIMYPLKDACLLLERPEAVNSNAGIAIGSSVGLLVTILAVGGFVVIRKHPQKFCSRSCYQPIPEDKERVRVYFKNTRV